MSAQEQVQQQAVAAFLAIGSNRWGTGPTKVEAVKEWRRQGGRGRQGRAYKVYALPEEITNLRVTRMGDVQFDFRDGTSHERMDEICDKPWPEV